MIVLWFCDSFRFVSLNWKWNRWFVISFMCALCVCKCFVCLRTGLSVMNVDVCRLKAGRWFATVRSCARYVWPLLCWIDQNELVLVFTVWDFIWPCDVPTNVFYLNVLSTYGGIMATAVTVGPRTTAVNVTVEARTTAVNVTVGARRQLLT